MSESELTQKSRVFYEQFQFPGNRPVDQDGLIFLRHFARSIERRAVRVSDRMLRVLDAGCGTGNTSVALARQFPQVAFFGIDQSRSSLSKAKARALEAGVANFQCRAGNLLRPLPWKDRFDVILCLGVLHHTADMRKGLVNLRRSLADDGELFLWIYGRHGRYRHSLNVRLLRMLLGKRTSPDEKLELATEFVNKADDGAALCDLLGRTKTDEMQRAAFNDPVWIADQFLNPQEILVDLEGLLKLVDVSRLELVRTLGVGEDVARLFNSDPLMKRFEALNPRDQLIAQDLLRKPERYFVVLRHSPNRKRS